jgi:2-haloacid dehalogenase
MVAAHLNDLKAAKANGLQTIYVERVGEEEWSDAEVEKAKSWVDLWVGLDGNQGFITVAEKMGIARPSHERKLSSSAPTPTGV